MPADIVRCECRRIRFETVLPFPFIELIFCRQIRYEIGLFLGRQSCIAFPLGEGSSYAALLSSRLVSVSTASSTRPTA